MHWWDGFVIGLANPGFLLAGLAGSVDTLGPKWAAAIWFSLCRSLGSLQAYIYAEPATMFPTKSGGLSMYAMEGWRKYFSAAGPDRDVRLLVRVVERARHLRRHHRHPADRPLLAAPRCRRDHVSFFDVTWAARDRRASAS